MSSNLHALEAKVMALDNRLLVSILVAIDRHYVQQDMFYRKSNHNYRPRSEGDNVIGSVRLSVRPSVCPSVCVSVRALLLGAKGGHYRSEGFVCLSVISRACADNCADAVDRLLIKG